MIKRTFTVWKRRCFKKKKKSGQGNLELIFESFAPVRFGKGPSRGNGNMIKKNKVLNS